MNMQDVANIAIPEGDVRTIHDKDNRLLWGKLSYDTKYMGDSSQNGTPTPDVPVNVDKVTGAQTITVTRKNLLSVDRVLGAPSDTAWGNATKRTFDIGTYVIGLSINNYYSPNNVTVSKNAGAFTVTSTQKYYGLNLPIDVNPSNTYCLSYSVTNSSRSYSGVGFYAQDGTFLSDKVLSNGGNFQPPAGTKTAVIVLGITEVNETCVYSDIQLELGSSVSVYEPYEGHSYTVNLGSTELCKVGTYQDYIYKSGSDWYVHKEIGKTVFTGSETWTKFTTSGMTSFFTNVPSGTGLSVVSNYFSNEYTISFPDLGGVYYNGNSNKNMLFRMLDDTTITEASDFKTWLGTHNTIVYYQLATPTDTKITDATLIAQLDAVHQFLTRYGYNGTVSGNLPIIIDRTNL